MKLALIDLQQGDEFFMSGKPALYKYAIPHYERAMKFNNSNADLNFKLGTCYFSIRKKQQALELLNKSIDLNPEVNPDAYYFKGRTLQVLLKWDEAIAAYMQYGEFLGKEEPIDDITRRVAECKWSGVN